MAVVGFNSWFKKYQSNIFASTQQTNADLNTVVVNGLYNGHLYLTNNNLKNITVKNIFLNNYKCPFYPINYSNGNIDLDLVYCLMKLENPQVVNLNLLTSEGLISKKLYSNGDLPQDEVDFYNSPFIMVINTSYNLSDKYYDLQPNTIPNNYFIKTYNSTQFRLPLVKDGVYDFKVCWGDGTCNNITNWNQSQVLHNYKNSGIYEINITGYLKGWSFRNSGCELTNDCNVLPYYFFEDGPKLTNIKNWGCLQFVNLRGYFATCINLKNITTKTDINLNGLTSLKGFFLWDYNLSYIQNINNWYIYNINNLAMMFELTRFNQNISNWDTSNIEYTSYMFAHSVFNKSLNNWNVSNVKFMRAMFEYDFNFNQPLNNWNVRNVKDMNSMFNSAISFNQSLNNWNVSNVETMMAMFDNAKSFNQPLDNWNTSKVTDMYKMFYGAKSFYQNISMWNVSSVTNYSNFDTYSPIAGTSYEPHFKN